MASTYTYNPSDDSGLDQDKYIRDKAVSEFEYASVCDFAIADEYRQEVINGNTYVFTRPDSLSIPTAPLTHGNVASATSPTSSNASVQWKPYQSLLSTTQDAIQASVINIRESSIRNMARRGAQMFDYHAMDACVSGSAAAMKHAVGQSAVASVTASNTLAIADVRKAVTKLRAKGAPSFQIPGIPGGAMLGFIHPYAAGDLKAESSGIYSQALNTPYQFGKFEQFSCAYSQGVLWVESNCGGNSVSPLFITDGASGSVDLCNTVILADQSLGYAYAPVIENPLATYELKLNDEKSIIVRHIHQTVAGGVPQDLTLVGNIGFGLVNTDGCYLIQSATSYGTNT